MNLTVQVLKIKKDKPTKIKWNGDIYILQQPKVNYSK